MTNNETLHLPKAALHEGEKKPEIALEFRPNLSDEDAVKQGVEWRRKANLFRETKKGNAEQIFQCFSESLGRLRYVIDDPKKQKEYNYILAIIEASQSALDKAAAIAELGTIQGESDTYLGLLESCIKWLTSLPQGDITTETNRLQASAFMQMATYHRDVNQNHALSEKCFLQSAEKLIDVLKTDRFDEVAQHLLESVNESLQSGKKRTTKKRKSSLSYMWRVSHSCWTYKEVEK